MFEGGDSTLVWGSFFVTRLPRERIPTGATRRYPSWHRIGATRQLNSHVTPKLGPPDRCISRGERGGELVPQVNLRHHSVDRVQLVPPVIPTWSAVELVPPPCSKEAIQPWSGVRFPSPDDRIGATRQSNSGRVQTGATSQWTSGERRAGATRAPESVPLASPSRTNSSESVPPVS